MTPQEAIKFLKETIVGCHILRDRQLKAVCEVSINALEKQIPKKPIRANRIIKKDGAFFLNDDNEYFKCPVCTTYDVPLLINQQHCHCCGQALDWSDTE